MTGTMSAWKLAASLVITHKLESWRVCCRLDRVKSSRGSSDAELVRLLVLSSQDDDGEVGLDCLQESFKSRRPVAQASCFGTTPLRQLTNRVGVDDG